MRYSVISWRDWICSDTLCLSFEDLLRANRSFSFIWDTSENIFKSHAGNISFRVVIPFFSVQLLMNPQQCFKDEALADEFLLLPSVIIMIHHQFCGVLKK